MATLVERTSRYVALVALPEGKKAERVHPALAAAIGRLPTHLRRSLTWDQGKEMAEHAQFTVATGVDVCFCDPKSPWQRGSRWAPCSKQPRLRPSGGEATILETPATPRRDLRSVTHGSRAVPGCERK